jgi:hypothetical protein
MTAGDFDPPARHRPLTTRERANVLAGPDPSALILEGQADAAQEMAEAELERLKREEMAPPE